MNKLVKRWKAETPLFFKRVIRIALGAGAAAGAILVMHEVKGYPISPGVLSFLEHVAYISCGIGGIAKFAQVDETK